MTKSHCQPTGCAPVQLTVHAVPVIEERIESNFVYTDSLRMFIYTCDPIFSRRKSIVCRTPTHARTQLNTAACRSITYHPSGGSQY